MASPGDRSLPEPGGLSEYSAGPPGDALVLYARVPRRGQVKTRMTPWLSADEAFRLHLALLEDSLALLRAGAAAAGATPCLAFSEPWAPAGGGEGFAALATAAAGLARLPQRGGDLGERLRDTFTTLAAAGRRHVVVIGCDSPTLPPEILRSAFAALRQEAEVVLGPAADGGYYLVGAARPVPEIFTGIPWSTDRVMEATLAALDRARVRAFLLPLWYDVDVPADLDRLRADLVPPGPGAGKTAAFIDDLLRQGRLPCRAPRAPA